MKLIFLGPPGAGKGTIAGFLTRDRSIPHISTGDLFRAAIQEGTPLGLEVKSVIEKGMLVSDASTIALVRDRLSHEDAERGWILDGFPRTIPQADALAAFAPPDMVIDFTCSESLIVRRLSGRRTCRRCGAIYHLETLRPKRDGLCDACGGELFHRDDDTEDSIRTRLRTYEEKTAPLIAYYTEKRLLVAIDSEGAPEAVYAALKKTLAG